MSKTRYVISMLVSVFGAILLLVSTVSSMSAPGSETVNFARMMDKLVLLLWGFGLVICSQLMRRPAPTPISLHPLLAELQHTNEALARIESALDMQRRDRLPSGDAS